MNLQTSALADRVSDFFKNSFHQMRYAAATAAGAAVIALSSGAAAQAPPTPASPAPAASASAPQAAPAPAPRRHLAPELQARVDAFTEICNNPTYMGWLTRYAVSCAGVDAEYVRLRLETPVGRPDRQEQRQWELYKFGDVPDGFDFLINPETRRIMAQGIANLHNTAVHAKNPRAPASDLLDPTFIDIVSAGAEGVGGSRFEVIYDLKRHQELYKTVGNAVKSRVKQRYELNTPVWNRNEILALDVNLLGHVNVSALRAKIDREQVRRASPREMYGAPGSVVFEKVDPATGMILETREASKDRVFELDHGVYVIRSKGAQNFTPFVDVNGDRETDLDRPFDFTAGWQQILLVRYQYTGAERLAPEVRRTIEDEVVYTVRVRTAPAGTDAPAGAAPGTGTPSGTGTETPAPEGAPALGTGTAPPTGPAPGTGAPATGAEQIPPPTPPTSLDAEAAGMFARLGPHFNVVLTPGYGVLSLEQQFEQSGYEARSSATGPSIAARVGGIIGEGNGLALLFDFDYLKIGDGNGTVERAGNHVGAFRYNGSWTTMTAEVAYARLLFDHRNESDKLASRRNGYVGVRAERTTANVSGTNITANEQTTDALLLMLGLDHASATLDDADHAVSVQLGAGLNNQSNTNGVDYDAGFSARIAAEYLARFQNIGLIAGTDLAYNSMSTGTHGQTQERNELSLAGRVGGSYMLGDDRQHRVGLGIAHCTTLADNRANDQTQVSEERGDTRLFLNLDLAF